MSAAAKDSHLPVLDGVRGLAILMVLLFHFWQGVLGDFYPPVFPHVFTVWHGMDSIGQKGVDLFFVLSGFLITGILLRTKGTAHYFKNFYIRRTLRIFPLYYAVVFVCLLGGAIFSVPQYDWSLTWQYLLYLQNIVMSFWPQAIEGPQHFWSLAVEEQFYLFWPFAVYWLSRRHLLRLTLMLVVGAFLARAACLQVGGESVFYFTLCRMDTLAIGALLAIFFAEPERWRQIGLWSRQLAVPIVMGMALIYTCSALSDGQFFQDFKYTAYALFFGAIIVWALSPGRFNPLPRLFQNAGLRGLGKVSYGMYVFHPFIFHKIMGRFYLAHWSPLKGHLWPALAVELFFCVGVTLLLAWLSWIFFEHPFVKLKDRFAYAERPLSAADVLADRSVVTVVGPSARDIPTLPDR